MANTFLYILSKNGCFALHHGSLFHTNSIASASGEATVKRLINFSLYYIADFNIPMKRGTFIEYAKAC
jgi:phosphomannomutase